MSQMTSTARVGARALNRPTTQTPRLRVVTGAPLRQGGAGFSILCASLLAIGLIGLLLLNTSLAQGSFTLHDLRTTSDQLTETQGALNQSLNASSSPANLAKEAASMGMVPAQTAAFLRLSDARSSAWRSQRPMGPDLPWLGRQHQPQRCLRPLTQHQSRRCPRRRTRHQPGGAHASAGNPRPHGSEAGQASKEVSP